MKRGRGVCLYGEKVLKPTNGLRMYRPNHADNVSDPKSASAKDYIYIYMCIFVHGFTAAREFYDFQVVVNGFILSR